MNKIQQLIYDHLPLKHKITSQGWHNFNAVCCQYNGEKRPDPKRRGNLLFTTDGGFIYNCYNCGYKSGWSPGKGINKKSRDLLKWLGLSSEELGEIDLLTLKLDKGNNPQTKITSQFIPKTLPQNSKHIDELLHNGCEDKDFIETMEYMNNRNPFLFKCGNFYWSNNDEFNMKKRIIVPAFYKGEICGYVARWARNEKPKDTAKYINQVPSGFLFNVDVIHKPYRKYVIVVEGVLDALSIDGVGVMNHTLSTRQLQWLKETDKEIVVLPDRDKMGVNLINQAKENGWSVSFPNWSDDIKDAEEAVRKYGRIFTLERILNCRENDEIMIGVKTKQWLSFM